MLAALPVSVCVTVVEGGACESLWRRWASRALLWCVCVRECVVEALGVLKGGGAVGCDQAGVPGGVESDR